MLQTSTLQFLKKLSKNNNKPWFDQNRAAYEAAKQDVIAFVQRLIDEHSKSDPSISGLEAKKCLFRINRDIRFSKDKSPYKINFGASITRGGKKSPFAGYYIHIQPGGSFIGGGIWQPPPEVLSAVRQEIDYNLKEFKKIISSAAFKKTYGGLYDSDDSKLSRVPKGYSPENPAAEWLKYKNYIAMQSLTDKDLTGKDLLKKSKAAFKALQPMVDFFNRSVAEL